MVRKVKKRAKDLPPVDPRGYGLGLNFLLDGQEQLADPEQPMTATTKLTPFTSSSMPIVSRTLPETVSMPMAAMAKPAASETTVLAGGAPPIPTKLAKARK